MEYTNVLTPEQYILVPKRHIDPYTTLPEGTRVYFLGGPIRGAAEWQAHMAALLRMMDPGCIVVVPNRWNHLHMLAPHFIPHLAPHDFPRQAAYERYWMNFAARDMHLRGCLLFWLPVQTEVRKAEDGPYAQDTYGELGRWSVEKKYDHSLRLVVGGEEKFPGLDQIKYNLSEDVGYDFPILATMEETAGAAVLIANT